MRPVVDLEKCIGCGLCADACPETFDLQDDGAAHVINPAPGHEEYDCIREAVDICPVDAITIIAT
jgi:ferredoxin